MSVLERNNVTVSGHGTQPIVFAHGFGCDQHMWRFVAPAFEATHRVVLFDHVGAGRSDLHAFDSTKYGTLDGYAEDVLEICAALDLTGVIFVGHSVSAMIGVLAAAKEPDRFDRLVLVGPSPRYVNEGTTSGDSPARTSRDCWSSSTATTSAGPPRWPRRSWATRTGPRSRRSWRTASAGPTPTSRVISPGSRFSRTIGRIWPGCPSRRSCCSVRTTSSHRRQSASTSTGISPTAAWCSWRRRVTAPT